MLLVSTVWADARAASCPHWPDGSQARKVSTGSWAEPPLISLLRYFMARCGI